MPSGGVLAAADHRDVVVAFPDGVPGLEWLGDGVGQALADGWKAAMSALWSAGLWVLKLAFKVIDAFTTPDLSANGPLAEVLPYTFYIGGMVAVLLALVQIGAAAWRRDGQSLGRVLIGTVQFGLVWVGYIGCAAVLVTASAGLTKGLLQGLLGIDVFAGFDETSSWPREVTDVTAATVLGVCTVFLIFPAAIGYLLIMLVREAALMLLVATSPITAAGLLSEGTKVWFWKSLRWFIACLLMAPMTALVLGVGVKATEGVIAGNGEDTTAAVGMAVVGSVLILIGALCPLILFRLLAFVDPGTSTGAAMRTSFSAAGGLMGVLSGGGGSGGSDSGSGAATKQDGQGRAQGESTADAQTSNRFNGMLGVLGQGADKLTKFTQQAAAAGSDVLEMGGVGHQAPYYGQSSTDSAAPGGSSGKGGDNGSPDQGGGQGDDQTPPPPTPPMPSPPTPPMPSAGGPPSGGGAAPTSGGSGGPPSPGGAGGGAGAGAGAAAEVPIVPV